MDDNGMPDDGQVTEQIDSIKSDVPLSHDAGGVLDELPLQRMGAGPHPQLRP
jgi:hypothetical protein